MIETYTRHAAKGEQLVGAYSGTGGSILVLLSTGWFRFYVIGGSTFVGLSTGAIAGNLLSLAVIAYVLHRRAAEQVVLNLALWALIGIYVARLPGLVNSVWNPLMPVFPFMALLFTSAAIFSGAPKYLPLTAFLASYVTQAHVGFAPTALALCALSLVHVANVARREPSQRFRAWAYVVAAVFLTQIVWLLPIAEEITGHPGNLTLLYRFLIAGGATHPAGVAWRAWGDALGGVISPDLALPIGHGWLASLHLWPALIATVAVLGALVLASTPTRSFLSSLAQASFAASVTALWSAIHIRGPINDYQIFWMSSIGVVNLALLTTAVVGRLPTATMAPRWRRWLPPLAAGATITAIASAPIHSLVVSPTPSRLEPQQVAVRVLSQGISAQLANLGRRSPVIEVDALEWEVASGVVLQLWKSGVPVGVNELKEFFGRPLVATGHEDATVVIVGAARHQELRNIPGTVTLAEHDGHWFADW
jgi:hypothetical protein